MQIRDLLPFSESQIADERHDPCGILLHIEDNASQGEYAMPRILLQDQDQAYEDEDYGEAQHPVSEFLFLDRLDIEGHEERSQRKEEPYRVDQREFVPLAIGMERFDAHPRMSRHPHEIVAHEEEEPERDQRQRKGKE